MIARYCDKDSTHTHTHNPPPPPGSAAAYSSKPPPSTVCSAAGNEGFYCPLPPFVLWGVSKAVTALPLCKHSASGSE